MLNIIFYSTHVYSEEPKLNSDLVDSSSPLLTRLTPSQPLTSPRSKVLFKVSEVSLNVVTQRPSEQQSQPNQPKKVLLLTRPNFTFSLFSFTVNSPH